VIGSVAGCFAIQRHIVSTLVSIFIQTKTIPPFSLRFGRMRRLRGLAHKGAPLPWGSSR
jgi:hypothetical protein